MAVAEVVEEEVVEVTVVAEEADVAAAAVAGTEATRVVMVEVEDMELQQEATVRQPLVDTTPQGTERLQLEVTVEETLAMDRRRTLMATRSRATEEAQTETTAVVAEEEPEDRTAADMGEEVEVAVTVVAAVAEVATVGEEAVEVATEAVEVDVVEAVAATSLCCIY